jgi:hypothetical protein
MEVCLRVATFLVADNNNRSTADASQSANDRRIISESPVAMQFDKIVEGLCDVVERVRTIRMTGNLDTLPARQISIDVGTKLLNLTLQDFDLRCDIKRVGKRTHFVDLGFKIYDRTFKL